MGFNELLQKVKANFNWTTISGALVDPQRFMDIVNQARCTLQEDIGTFYDELESYQEYSNITLITLPDKNNEPSPIAFVRSFPLQGEGKVLFEINSGNSETKLHSYNMNRHLTDRFSLNDLPSRGYLIPGPTSDQGYLNNGFIYRNETNGQWVEAVPLAQNKHGGIIIEDSGQINIAGAEEIQSKLNDNSTLAILPTSIYFEADSFENTQLDYRLFGEAFGIAVEQGYLETYNSTVGFLAQDNSTGEFEYFVTRISKDLTVSLLKSDELSVYNSTVAFHIFSALAYLAQKGTSAKVVMLEENHLANPIPYEGFTAQNLPAGTPTIFIYGRE